MGWAASGRLGNNAGELDELRFHRDYPVVLRAVLFAVDSHGAKITTGVSIAEAAGHG
jgi:hypothetical protein